MQVKTSSDLVARTGSAAQRAFEYTVLPARIRGDGEIVPGYPGQVGCIGWSAFKRYPKGYEQDGPVFGSERAAIQNLWAAHRFSVSLAINYAAPREERL